MKLIAVRVVLMLVALVRIMHVIRLVCVVLVFIALMLIVLMCCARHCNLHFLTAVGCSESTLARYREVARVS